MKAKFVFILLIIMELTVFPQGASLQLLSVSSYAYPSLPDSELFVRQTKTYDDFGNTATDIWYSWNSLKNKWNGSTKDEYEWDNKVSKNS